MLSKFYAVVLCLLFLTKATGLFSIWNRYVHAELHGASSTIIKNHKPDSPIPPLTLNQAGCFTVSQICDLCITACVLAILVKDVRINYPY